MKGSIKMYWANLKTAFKEISTNPVLLGILCLAFLLRVWGVTYGFPFLYPPDEGALINEVLVLPFRHFNPGHFDWPHFHYYLTFLLFTPIYLIQLLLNRAPSSINDSLLVYYAAGRLISVVMGVATVYLVYRLGSRLFNKKIGLLSAFILTVNLTHLQQSQLATLDAPMLFWLTLAMLEISKLIANQSLRQYLKAGFLVGLAASTKYNGAFAFVCLISLYLMAQAHIYLPATSKELKKTGASLFCVVTQSKPLVLSLMAVVSGFLIGTPFALLNLKTFLGRNNPTGALWQFTHVNQETVAVGILEKYSTVLGNSVISAFSFILMVAVVIGLLICFKKYRAQSYLIIPYLLGYFLVVGRFTLTPSHYFMPLFPFLSVLGGLGIATAAAKIHTFFAISARRSLYAALFTFLSIITLKSVVYDLTLLRKDTRTLAYEWILENIPPGTGIVVGNEYEPDLSKAPYQIYSIYDVLLNEDLSRPVYPKLNDRGIFHGVLGDYGLGEELIKASWDPNAPVYPDYLLDKAKVIARFDPVFRPGPTVMVFEIDYDYEVKNKHKTDAAIK